MKLKSGQKIIYGEDFGTLYFDSQYAIAGQAEREEEREADLLSLTVLPNVRLLICNLYFKTNEIEQNQKQNLKIV